MTFQYLMWLPIPQNQSTLLFLEIPKMTSRVLKMTSGVHQMASGVPDMAPKVPIMAPKVPDMGSQVPKMGFCFPKMEFQFTKMAPQPVWQTAADFIVRASSRAPASWRFRFRSCLH